MEFISGLMWGAGLSLGICVGLVVWVFLREALYGMLGITNRVNAAKQFNQETLAKLQERNDLTIQTIEALNRIAEKIRS